MPCREDEFNRIDLLFRQMKACNDELMQNEPKDMAYSPTQTSIADKKLLIEKAYLFYLSSFGMSYVKNLYLQNGNSLGNIMNIRCAIEGMAMYFHSFKMKDDEIELFSLQPYILEYNTYKNYKEHFDGKLFDFAVIKQSYENARQHYKGSLDLNSQKVGDRLKQKYPFLSDNEKIMDIIKDELGNTIVTIYKLMSMFVHPTDYRNETCCNITHDLEKLNNPLHNMILVVLERIFGDIKSPQIYGLWEEYNVIFFEGSIPYLLRELTHSLHSMLKNIMDVALNKGYVCLASWLYQIQLINLDNIFDNAFGYVEQGIIKWKQVVEFFAVLNCFLQDDYYLRDNYFLWCHSCFKVGINYGEYESADKAVENAYLEYSAKFHDGIVKDEFAKTFGKSLGFLINEKGKAPHSLKKLAEDFIDEFSALIDNNKFKAVEPKNGEFFDTPVSPKDVSEMITDGRLIERELPLNEFLKMCYQESQIMSHATGYMYFANTGAWAGGQVLGVYTYKFAQIIFDKLLKLFQEQRINGKLKDKTFINVIRNYRNKSKDIIKQLETLSKVPRIKKRF